MTDGANAREGVYPHGDATAPITIAKERGYDEIVAIIEANEKPREGDAEPDTEPLTLWHCAGSGNYEMAEKLLRRGADPNALVPASGDPMFQAYRFDDQRMIELLERYGGVVTATTAGLFRRTDLARAMFAGEAKYRLDGVGGATLAEQLLWGAACGGDPEIVRLSLDRIDWPRDDRRWFAMLEQPLRIWNRGPSEPYLECFGLLLERADPNLRGREQDGFQFGLTILHSVAGSRAHVKPEERLTFVTMLLDAGARLDLRDHLLESTPLGWSCRWGHIELVDLFLTRGADPIEADAPPWATPLAWAEKMGHAAIAQKLRQ